MLVFITHFIYFPEQQTLLPPHILCVVFIFITCSFIEDNNTRQLNDFACLWASICLCLCVFAFYTWMYSSFVPHLLLLLIAGAAATLLIFHCCSFSVGLFFLYTRSFTHSFSQLFSQCGSQLCVNFNTHQTVCVYFCHFHTLSLNHRTIIGWVDELINRLNTKFK